MDIEEIRERFSHDRFATECLGAVVDGVDGDEATCSFDIGPQHLNAAGGVMGGALFTLADFAFAVASNNQGTLVVSAASTIEFIGAAKGSRVIAHAVPDKVGRSLCFYTVTVIDDLGNLLAKVSVTGKRTSAKL